MKIIKTVAFMMCLFILCSFTACKKETPSNENMVQDTLVNSFETYGDLFDFDYSGKFILDVNSDTKYITDGNTSLKYEVGNKQKNALSKSTFNIPVYRANGTKDYRDFSKAEKVSYDVFNAGSGDVKIFTSLLSKKQGYLYSDSQEYVLKQNESTTIEYSVNRFSLYYALGIDQVTHISITVSGVNPILYFDNMRIHYGSEEFTAPEVTADGYNLLDFERSYHEFVTYITGTEYAAEIVNNPAETQNGNRYLRIYRKNYSDGQVLYGGGKLGISANYLSGYELTSLPETSYIAFDLRMCWNNPSAKMWIVPRLVSTAGGGYINVQNITIPADDTWHTVCIPSKIAPLLFDNIEVSFDGGAYGDMAFDNFRVVTEIPENAIVATTWSK